MKKTVFILLFCGIFAVAYAARIQISGGGGGESADNFTVSGTGSFTTLRFGTDYLNVLPAGTGADNQVLKWNGATLGWESDADSGAGTGSPGGAVNQIQFNYPSGTFGGAPLIVTNGSDLSIGIETTENDATLYIKGDTGSSFPLRVATSGATDILSVTQGGNVGMGTTNPTVKLQVVGGIAGSSGTFTTLVGTNLTATSGTVTGLNTTSLGATSGVITGLNTTSLGATSGVITGLVSTAVDINGGAIDGVTIGAAAAGSGVFTGLDITTFEADSGVITGLSTTSLGATSGVVTGLNTTSLGATSGVVTGLNTTSLGATSGVVTGLNTTSLGATSAVVTGLSVTSLGGTSITGNTGTFTTLKISNTVPLMSLVIYNAATDMDGVGKQLSPIKNFTLDTVKAQVLGTNATHVVFTLKVLSTDGTAAQGNLSVGQTATTDMLTITSFTGGGTVPANKLLVIDTLSVSGTIPIFRLYIDGHED